MKLKYFAVVAALVSCVFSANAQQENKQGKDIWIGISGGVISTNNVQWNKVQPYISIEVGKWITPVWGGRATIGGLSQYYGKVDGSWLIKDEEKWDGKQYFGELNLDGILNLSQLFSKKSLPLCDFYIFVGPTMNLAKECTKFTGKELDGGLVVQNSNKTIARFGASGGAGLSFNLSKTCALGLEYRTAIAPSVFGDISVCRASENTNRLSVRFAYTFGGRLGKDGHLRGPVETVTKTVEVPVEKEVIKEVTKEVDKIVTKVSTAGNYVFFNIGKSDISNQNKVRLNEIAKSINAGSKDVVYRIVGYADKATGSAKYNQTLSENRAKAVYDYLVKEGVSPDQLESAANGGVDNMFFDEASLSRVVTIIAK